MDKVKNEYIGRTFVYYKYIHCLRCDVRCEYKIIDIELDTD